MRIVPNKILTSIVALLLNCGVLFASEPGPPPPTGPGPPPPPPGLPLDGYIYIVLFLSISYGIYKLNKLLNIKKASN